MEAKATSTQNESFLEFENFPTLMTNLGAVKIWSRAGGREKADIDWRFKVHEAAEFGPTVFPNQKVADPNLLPKNPNPAEMTLAQILGSLTVPQLWKMAAVLFGVAGAIGYAGNWLGLKI